MATLEEMTTWAPDDIQGEILTMLPEGWRFEFIPEDQQWRARFLNAEGTILWWNTYIEPRFLLFDAFGWLFRRHHKTVNPIWTPRSQREFVPVGKVGLQGVTVPDPEDLDPDEIAAVYSGRPKG